MSKITANQLDDGAITILSSTVELNDEQIKSLPGGSAGEGFTLILAASGAGKCYRVVGLQLVSNFSVAYGNLSTNLSMGAVLGETGVEQTLLARDISGVMTPLTSFLTETFRQAMYMPSHFFVQTVGAGIYVGNVAVRPVMDVENQAVMLFCANADGNFTGGHPNNTLLVKLLYMIVNL